MPAVTILSRLRSVPPSKCFPFSNISSIQWGLDAWTEKKMEKRKTEKISLPGNMSPWQCPFQNNEEEQGGGNLRKFPCWGCISQVGLGLGSSSEKFKRSFPISCSPWQWALILLGILSLCGSRNGTSAPPKPIGLPLFQLASISQQGYRAPLPPPPYVICPGRPVLKLRTTGGRREALEVNFLSKLFSLLSAGTCLPFVLMHILVLIG